MGKHSLLTVIFSHFPSLSLEWCLHIRKASKNFVHLGGDEISKGKTDVGCDGSEHWLKCIVCTYEILKKII